MHLIADSFSLLTLSKNNFTYNNSCMCCLFINIVVNYFCHYFYLLFVYLFVRDLVDISKRSWVPASIFPIQLYPIFSQSYSSTFTWHWSLFHSHCPVRASKLQQTQFVPSLFLLQSSLPKLLQAWQIWHSMSSALPQFFIPLFNCPACNSQYMLHYSYMLLLVVSRHQC